MLVEVVERNLARFPVGFMVQLSAEEWANLKSQSVITSGRHGGRRTAPYAFTEQGVAMHSSVLGRARAIAINIRIVRTFVKVRGMAATHQDLAQRLGELEEKFERLTIQRETVSHNTRIQLKQMLDALRELMTPPEPSRQPIGFVPLEERKKEKPAGKRR